MTPGSVRALLPRLNVKNTHFLLLLPLVAGTSGLATACGDNGTTSAPLPLYVLPVVDGSTVFMLDAGKDAPLADGKATDARGDARDATPTTDAPHETSTTNDAHADVVHPADTGADAATTDSGDAAQSTPDASDAAASDASSPVDAATSTCSVEAGTCTPVCMGTGATLGWYLGGTLLCTDACTGLVPKCEHVGQPQQGWYTSTGHGCPPFSTEIVKDSACTP